MNRLAAAAALTFVLAACGPSDRAREQPESLRGIADAAAEAETGRTETVVESRMEGESHRTASTGIHDFRNRRSEVTSEFAGRRSRVITIGETSYAEFTPGQHDAPALAGKRWIRSGPVTEERFEKLNRDDCGEEARQYGAEGFGCVSMFFFDSSAELGDPGRMLDFLAEYGSSSTIVGREDVRGVPTTHVRTHVNFRGALEREYEEKGWSRLNIARLLENEPFEPTRADVWIDGDGLVRRVRITRNYEAPKDAPVDVPDEWGSSVATTDFFDFGIEVDIEEPAANLVIEFDDLLEANLRTFGSTGVRSEPEPRAEEE